MPTCGTEAMPAETRNRNIFLGGPNLVITNVVHSSKDIEEGWCHHTCTVYNMNGESRSRLPNECHPLKMCTK